MPTLEGRCIEKYTQRPVPLATIRIGGQEFLTDSEGKFSIDIPKGAVQIMAVKEGFEDYVFSLSLIANTTVTVQMTPKFRAL